MPVLTPDQAHALQALGWLFDLRHESRRQGRSTVLAIALIRQALMSPGVSFAIRDHTPRSDDLHVRSLAYLVGSFIAVDSALANLYRHDLLARSRSPAICFVSGLPEAATWLPPDWRTSVAPAFNDASWLATPADRRARRAPATARPAETVADPPPEPLSLWDRLDED